MVRIYMLPVGVGDFLWILSGKGTALDHYISIDGGHGQFAWIYKQVLENIAESNQGALIVMTHIDADHIQGAAQGLASLPDELLNRVIDRIVFNTGRGIQSKFRKRGGNCKLPNALSEGVSTYASAGTFGMPEDEVIVYDDSLNHSVRDAEKFLDVIDRKGLHSKLEEYTVYGMNKQYEGAHIRYISPGEKELEELVHVWDEYDSEQGIHYASSDMPQNRDIRDLMEEKLGSDSSTTNRSSLAFLFEYENVRGAFLGDAAAPVICKGLKVAGITKPYPLDFIKLPHHGGKQNMSDKLIKLLPTRNYLISTAGKPKSNVPSKELVAHIIKHCEGGARFYCNYDWWDDAYGGRFFSDADKREYLHNGVFEFIELSDTPIMIGENLEIQTENMGFFL